jgi:hypothetical protein
MKCMNWVFVVAVAVLLGGAGLGLHEGRAHRVAGASIDVAELALRAPPNAAMAAPIRVEQLRMKKRELETRLASLDDEIAQIDPNALRDAHELAW